MITFAEMNLDLKSDNKKFNYLDQEIEVKQYLPIQDKLQLISSVVNLSSDDNGFINPVKVNTFMELYLVYYYTNIEFNEEEKDNFIQTYDLLSQSGLLKGILFDIPEDELEMIEEGVYNTISELYAYKNSVMGILENISADYSNLDLEASKIQQKLANPNNMAFLKNVLTKLG